MSLTKKEEALSALFSLWHPEPAVEAIPVENAKNRVLAEDTFAKYTLPVVRAAMMDSVALRSADFIDGIPDTSGWTRGVEYELADMGDDFDDRFDSAIPVESVTFSDDGDITIVEGTAVRAGIGIKQQGSTVREGEPLLKTGCRLTPCDLTVLAAGGYTTLQVLKKPVVAVIPTGSELIARGIVPERGQNIEANTLMLAAMLEDIGAQPDCYAIVRDDPVMMKTAMEKALLGADIIVVNGGSSKGDEDFSTRMLKGKGTFLFHGVAAAPGKPLSITVIDNKPVINLPGPPPAAFNAAEWCLKAAVAHFLDQPVAARPKLRATLTEAIETPAHMAITNRLSLSLNKDGTWSATPIPMKKASLMRTMMADAFIVSKIGTTGFPKGAEIGVELLRSEEELRRSNKI